MGSLYTAADVKRWIPSIQREINFNLKQLAVPHYPERKIVEFRAEVDRLHFKYKRFIRRLRELDPSCKETPWQPRVYSKKRDRDHGK
ncbi:Hypp7010 [Branchiostoma lanceolatum]|uniref:Hypp7010 protein n=1 Tax=Branchiostoma lanceolatum TaxID=7740 RepID=A0A8K0EB44_BRALA|nr:Hypp7010 [Branchiostoma lanceolatum]